MVFSEDEKDNNLSHTNTENENQRKDTGDAGSIKSTEV